MSEKFTKILLAGLMAAFIAGAVTIPAPTPVYASEQTAEQEQQNSPGNVPQSDQNVHSGHHQTN